MKQTGVPIKQADAQNCLTLLNRLQLPVKSTGLGGTPSFDIRVAHTIFWEAGAAVRAEKGIADGMVRLSVDLE